MIRMLAPPQAKSIRLVDGSVRPVIDGIVEVPGEIYDDLRCAGFMPAPEEKSPVMPDPVITELASLARDAFAAVSKLAQAIESRPVQPVNVTVQPPKRQAKKITASRSADGKLIGTVRYEDEE